MIIIGITGTLGAGKGTVVDYLEKEKGYIHFSVRGYLARAIEERGEEVNRDTLTHTANALRKQYGSAYIIEELYKIALASGRDCVIESIRTPGEIASLRQKKDFILLAIDAALEKRFERIVIRNSETDHIDFDTFKENEQREMHSDDPNKQNLAECIRQADYIIDNNGSVEDLKVATKNILETIDQKRKNPTPTPPKK